MDSMSIAEIANPFIQTIFNRGDGTRVLLHYQKPPQPGSGDEPGAYHRGQAPDHLVTEDYENLPTINLVVQNVGYGPATRSRLSSPLRWRARTASCSPSWPFL